MTIGERIKKLRKEKKITLTELANIVNTTKQNIYKYENGIITNIPSDKIELIANYFNVSPSYIMGWETAQEDIAPEKKQDIESNIEFMDNRSIRKVPIFESVSAGLGVYASNEIVGYIPLYIENDYEAKETLCIKVKGDSMYPKIEDGDIIQVHKQDMVDSGQIAAVLVDGEEGFVKKIKIEADYLELISINPEYPPKKFVKEDMNRVSIVGLVKKIIKEC